MQAALSRTAALCRWALAAFLPFPLHGALLRNADLPFAPHIASLEDAICDAATHQRPLVLFAHSELSAVSCAALAELRRLDGASRLASLLAGSATFYAFSALGGADSGSGGAADIPAIAEATELPVVAIFHPNAGERAGVMRLVAVLEGAFTVADVTEAVERALLWGPAPPPPPEVPID